MEKLRRKLREIDGRGYKAYSSLRGTYKFRGFELNFLRIQGDPFATPSVVKLTIKNHGYSRRYTEGDARVATEDFIYRRLWELCRRESERKGTGGSGTISVLAPGQVMLPRSAVSLKNGLLTVKFYVGLPAHGRRILGREAEEILLKKIPRIADRLHYSLQNKVALENHVVLYECQQELRRKLKELELVAFVGDGSILPRESGVSDLPMKGAKFFISPKRLKMEIELSCGKKITGMGIPRGITLISGGGYHGKTTLLEAIQYGVYNHIEGDGREWVITVEDALKIRAEDGRSVKRVDISNFIRDLPSGLETTDFSTDDASGSTSMAASISEAMEFGVSLILIDEDTTATNFMIKDERMAELIRKEPIIPFVERIKEMKEMGISTIIVAGGAGEYLSVADLVIVMEEYLPEDETSEAKRIVARYSSSFKGEFPPLKKPVERIPEPESFSPYFRGKDRVKVKGETILYGSEELDTHSFEQIKSQGQLKTISYSLRHLFDLQRREKTSLSRLLDRWEKDIELRGLEVLSRISPSMFMVRRQELAMAVNRMRKLKIERE